MKTYGVDVEIPDDLTDMQITQGMLTLKDRLEFFRGKKLLMAGYLFSAKQGGYEVPIDFPAGLRKDTTPESHVIDPILERHSDREMYELCVRAFWWAFSKAIRGEGSERANVNT